MIRLFLLFVVTICFLRTITIANGVTPLKFHTHYCALIEATVVRIATSDIPTLDTNKFMSGKSMEESTTLVPVQKIQLRVDSILSSEALTRNAINILEKGSLIVITNPWVDQKVPFEPGDHIEGEVQLLSPHEAFDPSGKDNQWWFYNPEEKESNSPPRDPFKHVKILHILR